MKTFETANCPICGNDPDPEVERVAVELPVCKIENRFCSDRHRQDYLDKEEHQREQTPFERVAEQLREEGIDPNDFEG